MNEDLSSAVTMFSEDGADIGMSAMQSSDIFSQISLLLGTYTLIVNVVSIVISIISVIAMWKIFKKADEKGWKVLIPVYNMYIFTRIAWTGSMFPIMIILSIAGGFAANYFGGMIGAIIALVIAVSLMIFYFMMLHKFSKRFGHGLGFTLGLILFPPIFIWILGFGKSKYDYNRAIA